MATPRHPGWQMIRQRKPIARRRSLKSGRRKPRLAKLYAGLAHGKGNRRAEQDTAEAAERAYRAMIRAELFASDDRCQSCDRAEHVTGPHQMHEAYERSKTRGRPPAERYSLVWCMRVCASCHEKLQRHEWTVMFRTLLGMGGQFGMFRNPETAAGWFTAEQVWRHAIGEPLAL